MQKSTLNFYCCLLLAILLGSISCYGQSQFIAGTVVDDNGKPLQGVSVSVLIADSSLTTMQTDNRGVFRFDNLRTGSSYRFKFSYIGFEDVLTKTFAIADKSENLLIRMKPSQQSLNEVVVVGYGRQKKVNLTGAVTQLSGSELEDRPVSNLAKTLQGLIPNLNINFASGIPISEGNLNIRGNTSINGGDPLVIVDGVAGDMNRVNPRDVESVTVLKDAAASSIYGARGAFGVILITTKTGKSGKPKIAYNNNFGWATQTSSTDFMTSGYEAAILNDTANLRSLGISYTGYTAADYEELKKRINDKEENPDRPWAVIQNRGGKDQYVYYGNFDWWHFLYNQWQPQQDHNITVSGGNDKTTYYLSGGYRTQEGIWNIRPDQSKRYTLRSKISSELTTWLKVTNNTQFFQQKYAFSGSNDFSWGKTFDEHTLPSYLPVNPDGSFTYLTGLNSYRIGNGWHTNQLYGKSKGERDRIDLRNIIDATAKISKTISVTGNFSYSYTSRLSWDRAVKVPYSLYPGVMSIVPTYNTDELSEYRETIDYKVYNLYGTYENKFGPHSLKFMAGYNQEEWKNKEQMASRRDLLSEDLNDLNLGTGLMEVTGGSNEWALLGFYSRINYDYKGKYLLELNGRYDGTSRFKKGDRFGFFPSVSAGWRLSEEDFFRPLSRIVNNLKIRASYGSLGNQQVGNYAYIPIMNTATMNYLMNNTLTQYVGVPPAISPTLTWEKVTSTNLGLDIDMLRNRLSVSVDLYERKTIGMLTKGKTLSAVFGANPPQENAADLKTKGFELSVGWRDTKKLLGKPLTYSARFILSDYTGRITKFDNPNNLLSDYYVGEQLGDIWGYTIDGFFMTAAEANAHSVNQDFVNKRRLSAPGIYKKLQPGDLRFVDLNGDKIINSGTNTLDNPGDMKVIGNSQPRYQFGVNMDLAWNGFDIGIFLQGIGKQDWYPPSEVTSFWGPLAYPYTSFLPKNFSAMIWTPENPDAYFPILRSYIAQNAELSFPNNRYLQDLAYVRLKNLSVGYSLPQSVTRKLKLERCRFYLSGENLVTLTKLDSKYIDPELMSTTPDGRAYPFSSKVFSFGVDITF
ncbi:MAG: TonB-dependent receptor [Sphingobacteriales bacterium]|nr:TonB-dependent receptor [Sphingobacteriales bacterium]OJW00126.1 MAG: hypothetical protein BGO52_03295 [Sphingobacteriales bacterium 44-61]